LALSLSLGLIELVKVLLSFRGRPKALVSFLALATQIVLLWEFVRNYHEDWYLFLLSILGFVTLSKEPYFTPGAMTHFPFPFVSLGFVALTAALDIQTTMKERHEVVGVASANR
jgi:hypothetical protein